jgi:hypothetical protein
VDLVVKTKGEIFAAAKVGKKVPSRTRLGTFNRQSFFEKSYCANRSSRKNASSVSVFKKASNFVFSSAESGMPKVPSG